MAWCRSPRTAARTGARSRSPAGVPEDAYVQRILASQHDAGVVYVAYDNHQNGDFKPYVIKSSDRGKTWVSISGNLPERGGVYAHGRGPRQSEAAVRGHRVRPLLDQYRRRKVDQAECRAADHHGARPGHPEADGRSGDRHLRAQHLRAGRLQPAARRHAGDRCTKESYIFPTKPALSFIPQSRGGELWARRISPRRIRRWARRSRST